MRKGVFSLYSRYSCPNLLTSLGSSFFFIQSETTATKRGDNTNAIENEPKYSPTPENTNPDPGNIGFRV